MLWKRIKRQEGFTLIELLVVISIIGVLSTIALTSFNGVRAKARDARRKSDLNEISLALEQYYSSYGTYKVAGGGSGGQGWFNYQGGSYVKSIGNSLKEAGYFTIVPRDPSITSDNVTPQYMVYLCGNGFHVYAYLEKPSAADVGTYTETKNEGCINLDVYKMNYAVGHK